MFSTYSQPLSILFLDRVNYHLSKGMYEQYELICF